MEVKPYVPYKVPIDVLDCPITKRRVWLRDFWDGGDAIEITREDPKHICPVCQGEGHVTVLLDGHAPMIVQPEREEDCPAKCENGYLTALYGEDWMDADELGEDEMGIEAEVGDVIEILIWPNGDEEAIEGYTQ